MIPRRLADVTASDINDLVSNSVPEGRTLDYKEALPGGTDGDKKEFLRDVTSLANALGGDLVYGVREQRDGSGKATGLPLDAPGLVGQNGDAAVRRLDSMIRTGVAPIIPGYEVRAIDGAPSGPFVVVRVPRSWASPHMVTHTDSNQFWIRTSAQKQLMRVEELRMAFTLGDTMSGRLRRFRDDRLGRVMAGDTPLPLLDNGKIVLHLVPLSSIDGPARIDLAALSAKCGIEPMYVRGGRGYGTRFNLDGLLTFAALDAEDQQGHSYVQVFRTGAIEAVEAWLLQGQDDQKRIFPEAEQEIISGLTRCLKLLTDSDIAPPVALMLSLIGVRGFAVGPRPQFRSDRTTTIDRDVLLLPDVLVEDLTQPADVVLRPIFDALWQAAGHERCRHYGTDGRRLMPRR